MGKLKRRVGIRLGQDVVKPELAEEIREVAEKVCLSPGYVVGLLLLEYEGGVARAVRETLNLRLADDVTDSNDG